MSDRSWGLYSRAWRNFISFLRVYSEAHPSRELVFDVALLCKYASWRFRVSGVKGATIQADISGINAFLDLYGLGINLHHGASDPLQRVYRGHGCHFQIFQFRICGMALLKFRTEIRTSACT